MLTTDEISNHRTFGTGCNSIIIRRILSRLNSLETNVPKLKDLNLILISKPRNLATMSVELSVSTQTRIK